MPDWFQNSFDGPVIAVTTLAVRLMAALVCGLIVARIARWGRSAPETGDSLPSTLVLLCLLIAMVTQVIGDNVARAFSLVGALSIVRFRTVVQDTRDTAFVLFSVVVGMSVGAGQPVVAVLGMTAVSIAAMLLRTRSPRTALPSTEGTLAIRVGLAVAADTLLKDSFDRNLDRHQLMSAETVRQGSAFQLTYAVRMQPAHEPLPFVTELSRLPGVESVEWIDTANTKR